MEHTEFKVAARRLAKTAHASELASALARHTGLDVSEILNAPESQPIDFARAAEWLSQAMFGKPWNATSADFKREEEQSSLMGQWLACKNEQEGIDFLLSRSDLGDHIVSEMVNYNEEPMDDGRGFPRMRVSYDLVFDKPGNPRGQYAIYIDGNMGALVGYEAVDEYGDFILFEASKAFRSLLGKPNQNMNTFASLGINQERSRHGTAQYTAKQRLSDFCTTKVDDYTPNTFSVGGGDFLVQRELIDALPAHLNKFRDQRKAVGSLSSNSDFNTGFMAAVLVILGNEAASQPGLVLSGIRGSRD